MAIRVAHVGTGNVGGLALAQLITDPRFELTGVCVSTPEKVGRDAGELCGLGLDAPVKTGIAAVDNLDALLATEPECVVYCAMGDTRLPDAMADVMRILAAGVNVTLTLPRSTFLNIFTWPRLFATALGVSSSSVSPLITALLPL